MDEPGTGKPRTNIEIMQALSDSIAEKVIQQGFLTAGDSLEISMPKNDDIWIFSQAFTAALIAKGIHVFVEKDSLRAGQILFVGNTALGKVHYTDMFRDGLFGIKKIKRTISVDCSYQIQNRGTKEVLRSESLSRSYGDTISVDDVSQVESDGVRSTHAELPSENFLDKIVEPFVIIGATGVAVYLFFHIRS